MTFSWTQPFNPEMTETTPTSVATPMMMPSSVRKLRSRFARIACSASRGRSSASITCARSRSGRAWRVALLLLLGLHGIVGLQLAQRLEGTDDQRLAALEPGHHLQRQLAQEPRLQRLEARLAVLQQEHPLLVLRGAGGGVARLLLAVADDERLDRHHQGLRAEAGQDVGLHGEAGLDAGRRVLDEHLHQELDRVLVG